jgi:hypothetical protein
MYFGSREHHSREEVDQDDIVKLQALGLRDSHDDGVAIPDLRLQAEQGWTGKPAPVKQDVVLHAELLGSARYGIKKRRLMRPWHS